MAHVPGKQQKSMSKRLTAKLTPYGFVLPALIVLLAFKVGPVLVSIYGSMLKTGAKNVTFFVGLKNYIDLFQDDIFYISLRNTIVFNLITTPVEVVFAFILALVFNQKLRGIRVFRTIFYIPVCISMVMATTVWALMMNPYQGLLNTFLGYFGLEWQGFLTDPKQALACIMLIAAWKTIPYWMMFMLAGMQSIPDNIYEAAQIDGSIGLHQVLHITIPLMKNTFGFVIVSNSITNLLLFAPMYVQTNGGPSNATNVLMLEAYKSAYSYNNMGRSYSIVVILIFVSILFLWVQNKFFRITD